MTKTFIALITLALLPTVAPAADPLPSWNDTAPKQAIVAFGNSDGDFQMLEWTTSGQGARFGLIVHHTDAAREFAYDRESHIGKLDKGLDEAKGKGWTVVSMKDDWKTIFP
jgi:hypothetical protein